MAILKPHSGSIFNWRWRISGGNLEDWDYHNVDLMHDDLHEHATNADAAQIDTTFRQTSPNLFSGISFS
jgi:hypothetical protein